MIEEAHSNGNLINQPYQEVTPETSQSVLGATNLLGLHSNPEIENKVCAPSTGRPYHYVVGDRTDENHIKSTSSTSAFKRTEEKEITFPAVFSPTDGLLQPKTIILNLAIRGYCGKRPVLNESSINDNVGHVVLPPKRMLQFLTVSSSSEPLQNKFASFITKQSLKDKRRIENQKKWLVSCIKRYLNTGSDKDKITAEKIAAVQGMSASTIRNWHDDIYSPRYAIEDKYIKAYERLFNERFEDYRG